MEVRYVYLTPPLNFQPLLYSPVPIIHLGLLLPPGADTPECPSLYAPGYPARYAPGSISERNSWPFVQYPGGTGILLVSPSACVLPVVRDDD
ncbi:hypothetical protein J6590_065310 [Homalodisca vitripennis]|nr:hypothetical protein J6590_065310 [Homalodisca vitripennis]